MLLHVCTDPWGKAGWKKGMAEGHHFCSLPWLGKLSRGLLSKPCTAGSVTKVNVARCVDKECREDTETLWWSVPQEDSVMLKISPQALSCMYTLQDGLRFMQNGPPADLYFRWLPGIIWQTKKVALTPGFAVSLLTQLQLQGLPAVSPHCTEWADSTVQLCKLFHLLIHDHNVMQLEHF